MRKVPSSMNNRRPAGSSDSEWLETVTTYAHDPRRLRDRKAPLPNSPSSRSPGPLLSGAAFSAAADHKPSRD